MEPSLATRTLLRKMVPTQSFTATGAFVSVLLAYLSFDNLSYVTRAAAYSQLNKHDDAISDAKKASELDPKFSKAYSRLGHALFSSGRYAESVEAYEKGLALDPANQSMKNSLATAKSRVPTAEDDEYDADEDAITADAPRAGGGAGIPGLGAGGMPDLSSLLNNPQMMAMAQQMMGNGGLGESSTSSFDIIFLLVVQKRSCKILCCVTWQRGSSREVACQICRL